MNKHTYILILFTILFIGLPACEKEDFTEPVTVDLKIKLAEGTLSHVSFDTGIAMFGQILFEGHRDHGGDVHFSTEGDKEIGPIQFSHDLGGSAKTFDIPQGVYSHMQWRFILEDIDDLEEANDKLEEELYDFDGGLIIAGKYHKTDGTYLPLYIVVDDDEQFITSSQVSSGYQEITLARSNTYQAQLVFDPYYAMQPISLESLEAAEVSEDDDRLFIEISSDENKTLYQNIIFRLEKSVKVIIN